MSQTDRYPDWLIFLSVVAAVILTLIELPSFLAITRPALVLLVAIYWTLEMPQHFGLFTAWFLGIMLDVLTGSLLGQHAIAILISCYIAGRLRIRPFLDRWHQSSGCRNHVALGTDYFHRCVLVHIVFHTVSVPHQRGTGLAVATAEYAEPKPH